MLLAVETMDGAVRRNLNADGPFLNSHSPREIALLISESNMLSIAS